MVGCDDLFVPPLLPKQPTPLAWLPAPSLALTPTIPLAPLWVPSSIITKLQAPHHIYTALAPPPRPPPLLLPCLLMMTSRVFMVTSPDRLDPVNYSVLSKTQQSKNTKVLKQIKITIYQSIYIKYTL